MVSQYSKLFSLTEGTYYIGYINANLSDNIIFRITRKITSFGSDYLLPDPDNVVLYGSEITLNGGEKNSNVVTQGFTRLIYLSNEESRLDYYWYSSNENVARITDFGTVMALSVTQDTTVKIMAVNINNPSATYVKEFVIKKDLKTFTSDPLEYHLMLTMGIGTTNITQISLSSLNVPINWLQYYNWASSSDQLDVDQFGRIYAYPSASGHMYTITGTYKLNSRVKIHINVTIE
jgi:hypothetical protein